MALLVRSVRRTDEEWSILSEEMRKSGKSNKLWCKEHGINYYSLKDWEIRQKRKERGSSAGTSQEGWVSVELSEPQEQRFKPAQSPNTEAFVVQIGVCTVSVPPIFDSASLTEVCKVLLKLC